MSESKWVAHCMSLVDAAAGKTIASVSLGSDDALHFVFADGVKLKMWDDGQSCCERRYMTTVDDLSFFVGAKLLGVEIKEAPPVDDGYEEHEVQFLEVQTSIGVFTMASHNEHNGYYGGFCVKAELESPAMTAAPDSNADCDAEIDAAFMRGFKTAQSQFSILITAREQEYAKTRALCERMGEALQAAWDMGIDRNIVPHVRAALAAFQESKQ